MPVIFKPVGINDLSGIEMHKELPSTYKLSDIEELFSEYDHTKEEIENIKFLNKHTSIKKDEEYTYSDTLTILVFSVNTTIKEKLRKIFTTNGEKQNTNNKTEITVDPFIQKPIDKKEEESTLEPDFILDDETVQIMNKKSIELFNDEDFQNLIRIYFTKQHLFEKLNQYVSNGKIVKINISKKESTNLYEEEIAYLRKVGIKESDESVRDVLSNFNGHLNLSLRVLLCRKAILETAKMNVEEI